MASKHMKKCSISPDNRETQIKTTVRYYHIPIRMIKKSDNTTFNKDKETDIKINKPHLLDIWKD